MRRTVLLPLVFGLAVLTGGALGQTIAVVIPPPAGTGLTTAQTVRAFYDAANTVIRTGDVAALDPVVAPAFVDHAAPAGATPDRAGLEQSLAAIHALAPSARLGVTQVVASGDRAMAWVAVAGMEHVAFLGVAILGRIPVWGSVDAFRVASGRVVERWGETEEAVALVPLDRVPFGTETAAGIGLTLERVDFGPGDLAGERAGESRVLEVRAGTVTIAVDAASEAPPLVVRAGAAPGMAPTEVVAGTNVVLMSGDLVVLPATTSYTLGGVGTALVVAVFPADGRRRGAVEFDPDSQPITGMVATVVAAPTDPWPADLAWRTVVGATPFSAPPGTPAIGVGRVVLAPGAWLSPLAAPGQLLLVVEAGSLAHGTSDGASRDTTWRVLEEGDGALIPPGASLSLHNPGPLPTALLVVAVTSDR